VAHAAHTWRDEEARLLVREARRRRAGPSRGLIAAGVAIVVIVGGAAGAWFLGLFPFGGKAVPAPAPPVAVMDSNATAADSTMPTDSAAAADTISFGPIGFNAVDTAAAVPGGETGVDSATTDSTLPAPAADTTAAVIAPPVVPPPVEPAPALPSVIVPPGYAVADEIVVVRGLEVLSVAETSGGIRVTQRTGEGAELVISATVVDPAATTGGVRDVQVQSDGPMAVGTARLRQYRIEARGPIPTELMGNLLAQLERARPVN